MSETVVAKRYAEALFQLANEKNNQEKVGNELNVVLEVFQKNDKLIDILSHPRVNNEKKLHVIDNAFNKLSKELVNMLKLLVQRQRINMITSIIENYIELYNDANGIAVAKVYSVRPLKDEEKNDIISTFKAKFQKQSIKIENIIDPSLIGGLRIRIGNTIFDGSLSNKLNRFKHNLVSASK